MMRRGLLILLLALAVSACPAGDTPGTPGETPAEPPAETPDDGVGSTPDPPAATPTAPETLGQECTNPDGFTVAYPSDWITNETAADELPPCSLFDPESVELDEGMHIPEDIAVFVSVEAVGWETRDDSEFSRELEREELTLDGRRAVRREVEATGQGFYPEGQQTTFYRVEIDADHTLVAMAHDVGEPDYTTKQQILDEMMRRLRIDR